MATKSENERLAVVEQKVDNVIDDVAEIKKDVKELAITLENKFAAKWVERVVAGLIGIILTAFVGVLAALAFKQPGAATITRTTTVTVKTDGTTTKTIKDSTGSEHTTTTKSEPGAVPSTTITTEEVPEESDKRDNGGPVSGLLNGLGL